MVLARSLPIHVDNHKYKSKNGVRSHNKSYTLVEGVVPVVISILEDVSWGAKPTLDAL